MKNNPKPNPLFMVILVTLVCSLMFMINNGVRSNFGLITTAIQGHTGLTVQDTSTAIAISQLLYGFSQPFFGILALKKSNSYVLTTGGTLMMAGLLLIPVSKNPLLLHLSLGILIGLAAGALSFGIIMGAATPALGKKHSSLASGIVSGSSGLGGAFFAPTLQTFQDHGFFTFSMILLAGIAACVIIFSIWLGRKEHSYKSSEKATQTRPTIRSLLKECLTSRAFMHLAIAFFTCGFFMAIIESYLYPQLFSYGFESSKVAFVFSIYGVMGMIGPILVGFLSTKIHPKWVLGTTYGLRPIFVFLFLLLPKTDLTIYLFAIGLGLTGSSTVPTTTLLIGKLFGNLKMPTLLGIAFVFHQIGSSISTWIGSLLISQYNSYTYLWVLGAFAAIFATILCYTIKDSE